MFSLFGEQEIVSDVYRVAHPFLSGRPVQTSQDLRWPYLAFLQSHQSYMPVNHGEDVFITDPGTEDQLVAAYGHKTVLDDMGQTGIIGASFPDEVKSDKIALARNALEKFRGLDDTLAAVFDMVIHSVIVRPSRRINGRASYGGSSSAAIGVIWLAMEPTVSCYDIVEMFLHELTHHLLFIDERNHAHFDYSLIASEENRAYSAILNMSRPVDKVLHSVVVATELILGRHRFLPAGGQGVVHPDTDKMISDVAQACDSLSGLKSADDLLRPRSLEILDRCRATIAGLKRREPSHVA